MGTASAEQHKEFQAETRKIKYCKSINEKHLNCCMFDSILNVQVNLKIHVHVFSRPGPEVINLFSCSTQLSMKVKY